MPLPGYEEGVHSHAWLSSDSVAGIPIKKRRYLFIQPTSPPSETPLQQEHDEEKISAEQEPSSSNAGVAKEVSGCAFSNSSSSPKNGGDSSVERVANLVQNSDNCGLNLHTQASVSDIDQCQREFIVNDKSKESRIHANTELLLDAKEPLPNALAGKNHGGGSMEHEKLDPFKWSLGLSKGQNCSTDNDSKLKNNCAKPANRSHWDLNTTMESWEDSLNDATTAHGTDGMDLRVASSSQDIKPVTGTKQSAVNEQRGIHVGSGKTILDMSEQLSKLPNTPVDQFCRSADLLNLCLQPSLRPQSSLSQGSSCYSSDLVDSKNVQLNLTSSNVLVSPSKLVQLGTVKTEPVEDSRLGFVVKVVLPKLVDQGIVKPEPFQDCGEESLNSSTKNMMEVVDVKSEPNHGCIPENLKIGKKLSSCTEIQSGHSEVPISGEVGVCSGVSTIDAVTPDLALPFEFTTATRLPKKEMILNHSPLSSCTNEIPTGGMSLVQKTSNALGCVTSDLVSHCVNSDGNKPKFIDDTTNILRTECLGDADPEQSILDSMDEPPAGSFGNGKDEEKVNASADEEFSYDTDYESDGNHAIGNVEDTEDKQFHSEDDYYEDGEVREPSVHSEIEVGAYAEEGSEHVDGRISNVAPLSGDDIITSEIDVRNTKVEETRNSDSSEQSDNILPSNLTKTEGASPQESLTLEVQTVGSEKNALSDVVLRKTLDLSRGEDNTKKGDAALSSDITHSTSEGTATKNDRDDAVNQHEDVDRTNLLGKSCLSLSKQETCGSSEEAAKDVNGKGNRSRIITLPRASNVSSSTGTKPILSRMLSSQSEGERFPNVVYRSGKLHARGSRDERYMDHRFDRKRTREQPFGNTGSEFRFGRGRADNRLRSRHYDWDSSYDFSAEQCDVPTDFRLPRNKNTASAKLEGDGFFVACGDRTIGAGRGRGGRTPLNDELPNFRHPTSRRRSPGGRELMAQGVEMVRRHPRDISPERSSSRDDPALVGLRHEEKFMRGSAGDMRKRNTVFSRPQSQFERLDDSFIRADEMFSRVPLHIPRVRSKSPPRSRARSPGPWSSPRRRSPNGFVGHPELIHCRSPRVYRMERMRSPHQLPCFAEEMVVRRHDSPPYMSRICNDMREVDSAREHKRPRSFISNRSPSGRILPRNARRFDMVDSREMAESNEFFVGEMPPGRFHELVDDEGLDGRRECIDRRGPVRPFRPPCNGPDVENFRRDEEDNTRLFRVCPEGAELRERGNLRERGVFDRRMKSRPENPPRRTRSFEEQEENYWQNGQEWHDADFDNVSHMKRRF